MMKIYEGMIRDIFGNVSESREIVFSRKMDLLFLLTKNQNQLWCCINSGVYFGSVKTVKPREESLNFSIVCKFSCEHFAPHARKFCAEQLRSILFMKIVSSVRMISRNAIKIYKKIFLIFIHLRISLKISQS